MVGVRNAKPTIGFIGLGAMGSRMAGRLLDAGYPLGVYNRTMEKTRPFAERNARVYNSPRELARHADIVMSSLVDDAAVEKALLGTCGALAGIRIGATLIDLSSVHPDTSRKVAAAAGEWGVNVLDAPVSGSTQPAEDGTLVVFVGGDRATYERCRPIFDVIGRAHFHLGPNGAGAATKLAVNTLLGVGMQALAEAIALGERAGLDRDAFLDAIGATAVLSPGQQSKLENARRDEYPVSFALRLMWKDFGLIQRLAHDLSVALPATAAAQQVCAVAQADAIEEDFSAVIRTMRELTEVPTRLVAAMG